MGDTPNAQTASLDRQSEMNGHAASADIPRSSIMEGELAGQANTSTVPRGVARAEVTADLKPENPLELRPVKVGYTPKSYIPNTPLSVATISFILGITFSFGIAVCFLGHTWNLWWSQWPLGVYIAAWATFHWGEFAVTAGWNREKCSVDSFLLENGATYHIAHGSALIEYLTTLYFKPELKSHPYASLIGLVFVFLGQALRSAAMIHASTSFSHQVAFRKLRSHTLVTDGVYAWFRHPSYAGFFYWALGTQLLLQNPVNFVLFSIILWRFFYYRIKPEEQALIRFFGQEYVQYRSRVGTKIPFIP
ncbi:ICMT-domain-containing protein [Panus rudis PR-1116 ss-1]|nr:ICMT-domain-containing protein [Panus rudis PR-1116 ss-1]